MQAPAIDLNDVQAIKNLDTMGMFDAYYGLPRQCMTSCLQLPEGVELPEMAISNIVVTGLGGSAIGGDLLRVYATRKLPVPVVVNRDYDLPEFVGEDTLVFAVSYSGNTEETLSAYDQAKAKGATVVAITSGGRLKELAQQDGFQVIHVPTGFAPRAATGFLFIPTLRVLEKLGFLSGVTQEIEDVVERLKQLRENLKPEVPVDQNPAKQMALKLFNRIPVIWGSSGTTEVVAQRWKGQINENAKAPAYWNVLPELNHNEVVGFEAPGDLLKQVHVVILRDDNDHPRVQKRIDITKGIIGNAVAGITDVRSSGGGPLAQTFSLMYSGDYTSLYLAVLYGINPGPVKVIDHLKAELAKD